MRKDDLIEKIQAIRAEMEPLAITWAKISKKKFEARFNLEGATVKDLTDRYKSLNSMMEGSFGNLQRIWRMLPESQWRTTFAQQMRHLEEYQDLRRALTDFKNNFMNKKKKSNAESQAGTP